jgi:hypothetical protein
LIDFTGKNNNILQIQPQLLFLPRTSTNASMIHPNSAPFVFTSTSRSFLVNFAGQLLWFSAIFVMIGLVSMQARNGWIGWFIFLVLFVVGQMFANLQPSRWKTTVMVHLPERLLIVRRDKQTERIEFDKIDELVYRASVSPFGMNYLYWLQIGPNQIPLIAFNQELESEAFCDCMERRGRIRIVSRTTVG